MHEGGFLDECEDESQSPAFERYWDSEGEEELSETEEEALFGATLLAKRRVEESEDSDTESDEDSDFDTQSEQDDDEHDRDYVPNKIRGSYRCAGTSNTTKLSKNIAAKAKPIPAAGGDGNRQRNPWQQVTYEFCPLPHRLPIRRLLLKHFCLHPLLPESHGQPRTSEDIHQDSAYEMYRHCKNNNLRDVWAYLWTNWYSPAKWGLWARSAYPEAIPRKRTTMVVEAMWRNIKRLVLHMYNRPRVDFATYALVTQALPPYRHKLLRVTDDPREGRAPSLNGEQDSIKSEWLRLLDKKCKGNYDTDHVEWTCSCGAQKFHPYLLCKHLVQKLPRPGPDWWASLVRYPVQPFYDVRALLSPQDRARAREPVALGNRSWVPRVQGQQRDSNTPSVSLPQVCISHFRRPVLTCAGSCFHRPHAPIPPALMVYCKRGMRTVLPRYVVLQFGQ